MSSPRISIISHTYGRAAYLKDMIASVRASTPRDAYEILVVSSDPPETDKVKWLKEQDDVVFIQGDIRRPWQMRKQSAYHYINLGMKQAKYEWVVVFNDDMQAATDWYTEFAALVSDPKNANAGMIIAAMHLGKMKHGRRIVTMGRTKKPGQDWKPMYNADMAIMRKDVFEKIGFYEEKLDWAGGGADLALAFEFWTDSDIITTDKINIDHFIAKENRAQNLTNDFSGFHYVLRKWDKWCKEHGCQYEWDPGIPPYTSYNRLRDWAYNRYRVLRHYYRYFTGAYR
jgi:glycosyltransferase involved in cell wall biosynthesis